MQRRESSVRGACIPAFLEDHVVARRAEVKVTLSYVNPRRLYYDDLESMAVSQDAKVCLSPRHGRDFASPSPSVCPVFLILRSF